MVLAGGQRQHVLAIAHHDETGLFTSQKLFNDDTRAPRVVAHPQGVVHQHEVNRFVRLNQRHGHHHALARRQAIGLDHDRHAFLIDVSVRGCGIRKRFIFRGRNSMALHEGLGERLGTLQLGGGLGRTEHTQSVLAKLVHHASRQRRFRPHHRQRYFFCNCPRPQLIDIRDIDVLKSSVQHGARVTRRDVNRLHLGRLRQLPGQGMFTATAAYHEYVHSAALSISALW